MIPKIIEGNRIFDNRGSVQFNNDLIITSSNNNLIVIGYDEVYGARELGRVIQEKVKKPMAEELIFGALSKGGHVDITIDKDEISLKYSSNQDKKKELV